MNSFIPILNQTPELADCRDQWFYDSEYDCWCLEDILYTQKATTPKFQRMSIFAPKAYLSENGDVIRDGACGKYTAETAPVVFENNSAGYMQMPHTWLGGPRDEAPKYLKRGMVYVTCGCRGRESRDEKGKLCGKSPWSLIDLKTGIRFVRHNASVLPGDYTKMISVGWSAGGAMSSLLGVTGNHPIFDEFLAQNGAFMDEKDDVLAAQAYCPILDLDHADMAYEWQFMNDPENESSPAGAAGTMTPFQAALSRKLSAAYVEYFNSLELTDPETRAALTLDEGGRSGSAYDYLMSILEASAGKYLSKLDAGELEESYSAADYLSGNYTCLTDAPAPGPEDGGEKDDLGLHHAGAAVMLPPAGGPEGGMPGGPDGPGPDGGFPGGPDGGPGPDGADGPFPGGRPAGPPSLGDLVSRPPKGVPYVGMEFPKVEVPGDDKSAWLTWDGEKASISGLDDYILAHRRRMKPCTAFDTMGMDSGENQEFGTAERNYMHFDVNIAPAIAALQEEFPEEYAQYYPAFAEALGDEELSKRRFLINPMNYIGSPECDSAPHFRIRVGAQDADTAFTISLALGLKLAQTGTDVDYALVWDKPHCEADYPGEVCDWIESFV